MSVLPTLTLADIPRQMPFVERESKTIGNVKVHFYEQPTNGISHFRMKVNLKNLPEEKRLFLPMFKEFFASIGTQNYKYDAFNNKMLSYTNGIKVDIDTYT